MDADGASCAFSPTGRCIILVSSDVLDALIAEYPDLKGNYLQFGWQDVEAASEYGAQNDCNYVFARFVFGERKRKSLRHDINIVESFRGTNSSAALDV